MHAGDPRELGFEMRNRTQVWIVSVEVTKRPAQEREQLRLVMITLGANLDQLDKISRGLGAQIILTDARERVFEDNFGQRVQCRFAACYHRDFGFKEKIELASEWSFGAARAFGDRLNASQRLRAPGDDQTGVAKLAFA